MKFDVDQLVTDLNGVDISQDDESVTFAKVIFIVATTPLATDSQLSLDSRMSLYALAKKANEGGDIDLSAEEIVLIKGRAASVVASVVTLGRLIDFLET